MDTKKKSSFGISDSVAYAAGDFGCNMSFALKSSLIIFWTQFMGMGSELYALLLIIVQIWDGINDPLIGTIIDSDRRKYKRNKFLSYIWFGSIGLIIAGALCFVPIPNAPMVVKIIVFICGYVIWDAFYTIANVPYGSLLSLISVNPGDRASLSAWRSVGSMIGNMVPMMILPFIIYNKTNNIIGERVFIAALIMGILGFVAFQFMIRNTQVRVEADVNYNKETPKFNIAKAMSNFLKNRPAVGATLAAMGMFLGMQAGTAAVTVLIQSYFKNVQISGIIQVFSMLPIILFTPFARKMVLKYGKKELCVFGSICSVIACVAMFILPISPDGKGIAVYVICQLINSLGIGIYSTVSWSLMGDAIDYNEWKNGTREEGTVYSLHSFFRKLAQGFGPSLVLIVMAALGYMEADKGNQLWEVAMKMRYLVPSLYLLSAVMMVVGLAFIYNLNKATLEKMNKELGR
ncbi:MAG: glucuronide permease [Anaerocolumna sp.]|jgi:GPH family glycoside/pentoside/hexuronide:cation symporter|nr:glucuronide permease [Anaerocolumna sp.]